MKIINLDILFSNFANICLYCKFFNVNPIVDSKDRCRITFPEYELVTEAEPSSDACTEEVGVYEEKYEQYLQESNVQKVDKKMERELMKMEEKKTDDMFERFKKRIKREPKQVHC